MVLESIIAEARGAAEHFTIYNAPLWKKELSQSLKFFIF